MARALPFALLLLTLAIPGCERTKIIDQISIIHTVGYDIQEDGQYRGTILYPDYTKSKSQENIQIRKARGSTSSILFSKANEQTKNSIELSKVQEIVFGEEFAKKGIGHIIDTVFNNPMIATDIQTAVVTPTARKYLEGVKENGTLGIADTIVQNYTTSLLPRTNLHIFLNNYYGEGRDPYMPILMLGGGDKNVSVGGIALFKDDQLKLTLNNKQTFFLGLLDEYKHMGQHEIPFTKDSKTGTLVVRIMDNKSEWKVRKSGPNPEIDLFLNVFVIIREYPNWIDLHKEGDIQLLEKTIKRNFKGEISRLVASFKEKGVDPLGFGDRTRASDRTWEEKKFYKEQYSKLKVNIDINLTIIQAGIMS
ncbi:Ger(x)C family spore germination protein [Bacillus sp. FJAT-27445]|uniref:Ger(x)C family spore germination protein n=1 Tax=Bacillus sp. FJAT-27445 TaxID=1679166 RepID=UPI0007444B45|nr:Ger(x)C family spore germination protein [Bacillus sp. FJAT-27445]